MCLYDTGYICAHVICFYVLQNKDGLIYADVDLLPGPSGNRFVIRGQENRTNYAIIDLSKKAKPLPSDSEDEDNDSTNLN